ncbi:MAG: EAL domain-containing protein [Gammaproteobacteria bacterium]
MDKVLRLVMVETDLNDAERMISSVKSAGFAVRAVHADNEDTLLKALNTHQDMVLHSVDNPQVSLEQTMRCTRQAGKRIPVIAIAEDQSVDAAECMQIGASDMVIKGNADHLRLVVTRAAETLNHWRELKRVESALHETEKRCRHLLDSSRDAICYVHDGMHVYANQSYLELFGYTDLDDVEGMPIMDMVNSESQDTIKRYLRVNGKASTPADKLQIKLKRENGESFAAGMEFTPASIDGEPCLQIVIRDEADTRELEEEINYLKVHDAATGLYNRAYFLDRLESAIKSATQGEQNSALVQLFIANMESIKDTVGLAAADLVIADLARILAQHCAESEVLARFSVESFAILTLQWGTNELESFAARIHQAIDQHTCDVEGKSIGVRVEMGAVQIDENAPDSEEVLLRCDRACTEVAQNEYGGVSIYVPHEGEMTQKQLDESWDGRIREALIDNRIRLLYQPIVSLHGETGERYSVFMQMIGEQGEEIPASEFMPSAERIGLAKGLDRWVILNAFRALAHVRNSGADVHFFFKLSANSVQDPGYLPWLSERLRDIRVPPSRVVFGAKEEVVLNYLKQTKDLFKGLKQMNCQFGLDDFGTGLNPFQLLKYVPADFLKFDGSLMRGLSDSAENQEAIRKLTNTAHSMNKMTVAQFVEDATVLSVLWGMGVNYIQGNFLQAPSENLEYDFTNMG